MKFKLTENDVKRAIYGDYRKKIFTFATFSAENPMAVPFPPTFNNKRTESLKREFSFLGLQYKPLLGKFDVLSDPHITQNYGDTRYDKDNIRAEHSFIVYNININQAKALCKKYGQKSFFFGYNFGGDKEDIVPTDTWAKPEDSEYVKNIKSVTTSRLQYWEVPEEESEAYVEWVHNGMQGKAPNIEYKLVEETRRIDNANDFDNFFSRHKDYKYSAYLKVFNEGYDELKFVTNPSLLMELLDESYSEMYTGYRQKIRSVYEVN